MVYYAIGEGAGGVDMARNMFLALHAVAMNRTASAIAH